VEVCWDGVDNDACVAEYKVRTRIHTDYYRRHYDHPEEISKGGCVVIGELQNNVKYEFSVMAYGKRNKKGIPTYVLATPKHYHYHKPAYIPDEDIDDAWEDDYSEPPHHHHDHKPAKDKWKCHSIANSYPDCEASKKKLCLPMSCKDQVCFYPSFKNPTFVNCRLELVIVMRLSCVMLIMIVRQLLSSVEITVLALIIHHMDMVPGFYFLMITVVERQNSTTK
jgi:hypothetical protein